MVSIRENRKAIDETAIAKYLLIKHCFRCEEIANQLDSVANTSAINDKKKRKLNHSKSMNLLCKLSNKDESTCQRFARFSALASGDKRRVVPPSRRDRDQSSKVGRNKTASDEQGRKRKSLKIKTMRGLLGLLEPAVSRKQM